MKCRSSAGCGRPAGHGRHGSFCAHHAAELAALRDLWFTPDGTVRKTPAEPEERGPSAEDDARRLSVEVLRDGLVSQGTLRERLNFTHSRLLRAVAAAERAGWIGASPRGLVPGERLPEGKLPKEVRAAMLGRYARERGVTVSSAEAAAAVGLTPGGSFPRVLRLAVEWGLVTTANGPGGGVTAAA